MSQVGQMDMVLKYINANRRGKDVSSLEDLYMSVLMPSHVGKPHDTALPQWAYKANKGLDINKDGQISIREATSKVRDYLPGKQLVQQNNLNTVVDKATSTKLKTANLKEIAQTEQIAVQKEASKIAGETALAKVKRQTERSLRDMQRQTLSERRGLTDLQFEGIAFPTTKQESIKASTENLRQYQDKISELKQRLADTTTIIKQADKAIETFSNQAKGENNEQQLAALEVGISSNTRIREQALQDKASLEKTITETEKAFQKQEKARVEKVNFDEYLRASKASIDLQTQENLVLEAKINQLEAIKEVQPNAKLDLPQLREQLSIRQLEVDLASKLLQVEEDIKRSGNFQYSIDEYNHLFP